MKKRALIIAYNIHPEAGSEESVAWSYLSIAARNFEEVVVYTQDSSFLECESLRSEVFRNCTFVEFNPPWIQWFKRNKAGLIHYLLWHFSLNFIIKNARQFSALSRCNMGEWDLARSLSLRA